MVGLRRFELPTSCPPDKRANQAALQPATIVTLFYFEPFTEIAKQFSSPNKPPATQLAT